MTDETSSQPTRRAFLRAGGSALVLALPLSGCLSFFGKPEDLIQGAGRPAPATVDPGAAAREISAYRRARGLSPVAVDSRLTAIAREHSQAMARADRMAHNLRGEPAFERRLANGGYDASVAVENVAAGHRNFSEVFAGWKASRGHNANMLRQGVTQMGIAVAYTPNGQYGNFWTLVLAAPDERRAAQGPDAGPLVPVFR